jgi:Ca2+-binding RTX toxin-like protein
LVLSGADGVNEVIFAEDALTNIEAISLNNRFATDPSAIPSYDLVLANGNVTGSLIVNGSSLGDNQTVSVNGSAVTGGTLTLYGGAGEDSLTGGAMGDRIEGGWGGDQLRGGAGADTFVYRSVADSLASGNRDAIQDFTSGDLIDLSAIDAVPGGPDSAFTFIDDDPFNGVAGELRATFSGGIWTIQGDLDGDKAADLEFFVVRGDADPMVVTDFIL